MWNSQPFKWSASLRCACRLSRIPPNSGSIINTAFSRRWPASMLIYLNKRKHLHEKRVQLPQDWFRTLTWPPFHCFGTPIWPPWRHVKMLYKHIHSGFACLRACLHGGGGPQVGEVTHLGGVTDLSIWSLILIGSRLHDRWGDLMTDYMDRRVTPPKWVTSPTWGPPPIM